MSLKVISASTRIWGYKSAGISNKPHLVNPFREMVSIRKIERVPVAIRRTFKEFFRLTTLHGYKYLAEDKRHFLERFLFYKFIYWILHLSHTRKTRRLKDVRGSLY